MGRIRRVSGLAPRVRVPQGRVFLLATAGGARGNGGGGPLAVEHRVRHANRIRAVGHRRIARHALPTGRIDPSPA
eukprot:10575396-Lingulodinium_polyedra.AAC.1